MADILGREEAARRAALLGDVTYNVILGLGDGRDDTFASICRVGFTCAEPGASTFIDLTTDEPLFAVLNGRRLPDDAFDGHRLRLDDLQELNRLVVHARCAFRRTGTGLHRFVDPADDQVYVHTQFEPFDAHTVYACFDQPDLKARFELVVSAPPEWTVVSNETVASRRAGPTGNDVWSFQETPPIAPYITALVAGPMHAVFDDTGPVRLGLFCRESLAEYLEPDEFFTLTRAGMTYFGEVFGQPYPFSKYDQLFVPEFNWGAMENAGCVTFSESHLFRSRVTTARRANRGATILHELAHMWFGNLVTMRWWGDLWLNESFATYMSFRALTERTRFTTAWLQFLDHQLPRAIRQDQLPTTHPIVADAPDTDTALNNFDGITYSKGALVLRQLVAWVGDDAFARGLQAYFARHAWGNAELADFLAALGAASGRELGAWSRQWLETTGVPTLAADAVVGGDETYRRVDLVQRTGSGEPRPRDQRAALGVYDVGPAGDVVRRMRIELDVTAPRTTVTKLAGEPRADLLIPDDGALGYAKSRLDVRSLGTLHAHLRDIADPLTRTHCWLIAWDMLRDAELPAREWLDLFTTHAGAETEAELLRSIVGRALSAAARNGDPAPRDDVRAAIAATARAAFDDSAAGSDRQLVWARCRIQVDDPRWTLDVLTGRTTPEGLAVDHDLRWTAVTALARRGVADEAMIAAEHDRDRTDEGARRATTARASRPTEEAKADAWGTALDDDTPLATRRAACSGFHQYDQTDLLRPYVDRFVAVLPDIWAHGIRQVSLDLTELLFPSTVAEDAAVAAGEQALALDVPEAGRRLVIERLDELHRTIRARAADASTAA